MRTFPSSIAAAILLAVSAALTAPATPDFHPAAVTEVTDAARTYVYLNDGFFVLNIDLDRKGKIANIEKLRDPGAMINVVTSAARSWKFSPATIDGTPSASSLAAIFVYRPTTYVNSQTAAPANLTASIAAPDADQVHSTGFAGPQVLAVTYPEYPASAIQDASVIVQLTVAPTGAVTDTQILHDAAPFTKFALDALHSWQFAPAKLWGKPVASKVAIAFVFQPPPPATSLE